jgi:RecB family endonuclease NucS
MINVSRPFALFARASIKYSGRAESTLQKGNYLIIRKKDGSLLIHGSKLTTPLNYQPPNAIIEVHNNKIISKRKGETITIIITKIHFYFEPYRWSNHKIEITKTEQTLRKKIINNINTWFTDIVEIHEEYNTPLGDIDMLIITKDLIHHVIELKRKKCDLSSCSQVKRYCGFFTDEGKNNKGYLMAPDISASATKYIKKINIQFIKVQFDG